MPTRLGRHKSFVGAWEDGGREIERGRHGGPEACDQVRVGTRFALNEDEVPYLPAVRRRVWTCVRGHRPSLGWRHREMLELAAQALSTSNDIIFNLLVIFLPKH